MKKHQKTQKRLELGEEKWKEHQKKRNRRKWRKYYRKNASYVTCWRIRIKLKLIEYKGGKCEKCGFNKPIPRAYDFHHKNPSDKLFVISSYKVLNWDKLVQEVDKCWLVCRNCHAEIHHDIDSNNRNELLKSHENWLASKIKERPCKSCGIFFKPQKSNGCLCKKCGTPESRRKVKNRPNKKELEEMIGTMTWVAIGRKYGVTDNTVRRWAIYAGITWKKRVY